MVNKVVFTIKIFPQDTEVDLSWVQDRIKERFPDEQILRSSQEPVAFGLKSLVLDITAPEEDGVSDRYERLMKEVPGVSDIQVESVRRLTRI